MKQKRSILSLRWFLMVSGFLLLLIGMAHTPKVTEGEFAIAPQQALAPTDEFDLTGNGVVNAADGGMVAESWELRGQEADCLANQKAFLPQAASLTDLTDLSVLSDFLERHDMDGNGCLEVADVQLLLAHWGQLPNAFPQARSELLGDTIFVVNLASDEPDSNPGDGICQTLNATDEKNGNCTLRAALQEANVRAGRETIHFDIRLPDGTCPPLVTIQPVEELVIDDAHGDGLTIDGYTQCGSAANTQEVAGNAIIKIEVQGRALPTIHGLAIKSPYNIIRGLAIYNFEPQIHLTGAASYNRLEGNFLGTNAENSYFRPTELAYNEGIRIRYGASYNLVGCGAYDEQNNYLPCQTAAEFYAARNLIAGNNGDGIGLVGSDVVGNRLIGNYIGVKQDGSTPLPNQSDGVDMGHGPQNNWIGGTILSERNVISANRGDGIELSHDSNTKFNHLVGNYIGIDASGTLTLPNRHNGITLEDTVDATRITHNVIGNNGSNGIRLYMLITNSQIENNQIGVAPDGITPMPNGSDPDTARGQSGILALGGSQYNQIRNNLIAFHPAQGIHLSNTSDDATGYGETFYNRISRNSIYENGSSGIFLNPALNPSSGEFGYPNQGLPAPTLAQATTRRVAATTCADCLVELFLADKDSTPSDSGDQEEYGEGKTFIASGQADASGNVLIFLSLNTLTEGQLITATATDPLGNTSQFSRNVPLLADDIQPALWLPIIIK